MNTTQRLAIAATGAALLVSLLAVPFRYVATGGINGGGSVTGTAFEPIFAPPKSMDVREVDGGQSVFIEASELDAGKLGLIWAGILVLGTIATLLYGGSERQKQCPACAEMVLAAATKCRFCGNELPATAPVPTIVCVKCGTGYPSDLTGCNMCGKAKPA